MKVFISHSSHDKKFVRTLKADLKENSIDVWLDEDQLELGDSLIEKLELALEESSHFLIILSPFSVNSDWVKFELDKAFKQKESALLNKIIPIKYRQCETPKEIKDLIYSDLSNETVQTIDDKVKFISNGYQDFLIKLVRAIRSSPDKTLSTTDRNSIKESIKKKEQEITANINQNVKGNYLVNGYKDINVRQSWEIYIRKNTTIESVKELKEIRPILLPPLLKNVFKNLKVGEKLIFTDDFISETFGHFAGYRKDDLCITIDPRVRNGIGIKRGHFFQVEIDTLNRRIIFLGLIK